MNSRSEATGLPKLIAAGAAAVLLQVDRRVTPRQLEDALIQSGCMPVGTDTGGNRVWMDTAVLEVREAVALVCRGQLAGVDVGLMVSVLRDVLDEALGPAVERAMSRHLGGAIDDVDGRLDKLLEQGQGLFRQQGENGQRMRDVLNACNTLTGELRASNAAVKKDVGALLTKFEKQTELLMRSVAEEQDAVRRSLNELAKVVK